MRMMQGEEVQSRCGGEELIVERQKVMQPINSVLHPLLVADWLKRGGRGCRDSKDVRALLKTCRSQIRSLAARSELFLCCRRWRLLQGKDEDSATRARLFLIIRLAVKPSQIHSQLTLPLARVLTEPVKPTVLYGSLGLACEC